MQEMKVKCK